MKIDFYKSKGGWIGGISLFIIISFLGKQLGCALTMTGASCLTIFDSIKLMLNQPTSIIIFIVGFIIGYFVEKLIKRLAK